ncbi:hypothetical protein FHR92_002474 [Fontibacillus solani]|uniref:Uncharacterized protein n=1 Tax=Fontibacillus solani TaxID=1572857 RepID=A0A7W3STR8_9BACL|nr:hypothetical protein [Fontibacillus solani]
MRASALAQDLKEWAAQHLQEGGRSRVEALRTLETFLTRYDAYRSIYLCLFSYAELRFSIFWRPAGTLPSRKPQSSWALRWIRPPSGGRR